MAITAVTRRALFADLRNGAWWGDCVDEIEFLSLLYDLDQLPSNDARYTQSRWTEPLIFLFHCHIEEQVCFYIIYHSQIRFQKAICEPPDKRRQRNYLRYRFTRMCLHPRLQYNVPHGAHWNNDLHIGWDQFKHITERVGRQ